MLRRAITLLFLVVLCSGCPREPSVYHSRIAKISGDNGYQIKVSENHDKYIPGKLYTRNDNFINLFKKSIFIILFSIFNGLKNISKSTTFYTICN